MQQPRLNDRIKDSGTQIAGYRIQPYKAVTDQTAYGNRFMSPVMNAPSVFDSIIEVAPVGTTIRGNSPVTSTPSPQVIRNGATSVRGNNAPSRRGGY